MHYCPIAFIVALFVLQDALLPYLIVPLFVLLCLRQDAQILM